MIGFACILWVVIGAIVLYQIFAYFFFHSKKFLAIKESIANYTQECNALNEHIENLKNAYIDIKRIDYGHADYVDNSIYNFARPELKKMRETPNVYNCSLTVCKNAQQQPFKYLCKYFGIKADEKTLSNFEHVLNSFAAVEQGKVLLKAERDQILEGISTKIPYLIRKISEKRLIRALGFADIDFSQLYFPKYTFEYVSAGGNSSMHCDIVFDIANLERFIRFLAEKVKFRKSVAGQRQLLTPALREQIKQRDHYTCRHCGVSVQQEPHLLLEIDHIIPLSKGGLTTADNLQTLCWKCNRTKGSKNTVSKA